MCLVLKDIFERCKIITQTQIWNEYKVKILFNSLSKPEISNWFMGEGKEAQILMG